MSPTTPVIDVTLNSPACTSVWTSWGKKGPLTFDLKNVYRFKVSNSGFLMYLRKKTNTCANTFFRSVKKLYLTLFSGLFWAVKEDDGGEGYNNLHLHLGAHKSKALT